MFAAVTPILTLLVAAAVHVRADPNPTNPGPGDVFIQGQPCTIGWDVDPTGVWKTMDIHLMTGDNFDMVSLTAVATAVDGTNPSKNTFSFTCPQVTPPSPIYFYQFTSPSTSNKTWTGRFTITDSVNDVVPPAQSTQPDGSKIPWGTGSIVNGSSSASGASVATSSTGGTTPTASSTPSITPGSPLSTSPSGTAASTVYLTTGAATPSTGSTAANGAVATLSVSSILFQTGLALGLAALGFSVMF